MMGGPAAVYAGAAGDGGGAGGGLRRMSRSGGWLSTWRLQLLAWGQTLDWTDVLEDGARAVHQHLGGRPGVHG